MKILILLWLQTIASSAIFCFSRLYAMPADTHRQRGERAVALLFLPYTLWKFRQIKKAADA